MIYKLIRTSKNGTIRAADMLIDDDMVDTIAMLKPCHRGKGYAGSSVTREYIHRIVVGAKKGECVDHINGNRLDNRRENLRIVSMTVNHGNHRQRHPRNTNGVRGVQWVKRINKKNPWVSQIVEHGKARNLGYSPTLTAAIQKRHAAELALFGELCPYPPLVIALLDWSRRQVAA